MAGRQLPERADLLFEFMREKRYQPAVVIQRDLIQAKPVTGTEEIYPHVVQMLAKCAGDPEHIIKLRGFGLGRSGGGLWERTSSMR